MPPLQYGRNGSSRSLLCPNRKYSFLSTLLEYLNTDQYLAMLTSIMVIWFRSWIKEEARRRGCCEGLRFVCWYVFTISVSLFLWVTQSLRLICHSFSIPFSVLISILSFILHGHFCLPELSPYANSPSIPSPQLFFLLFIYCFFSIIRLWSWYKNIYPRR